MAEPAAGGWFGVCGLNDNLSVIPQSRVSYPCPAAYHKKNTLHICTALLCLLHGILNKMPRKWHLKDNAFDFFLCRDPQFPFAASSVKELSLIRSKLISDEDMAIRLINKKHLYLLHRAGFKQSQ